MRDNDESTKHASCTRSTTTARLPPRGTPSSPIPSVGMPGGRPDPPPADAQLATKEPAMSVEAAFALGQRPMTSSITACEARPRTRKSRQ
eukprot:3070352-Prymnesium_polylepis.1